MLQVIQPLPLILGSVLVAVEAVTVGFVVAPLPLVAVPVYMVEAPETARLVLAPLALVPRSVHPVLNAPAITHRDNPLALVRGATAEGVQWPLFALGLLGGRIFVDSFGDEWRGRLSLLEVALSPGPSSIDLLILLGLHLVLGLLIPPMPLDH